MLLNPYRFGAAPTDGGYPELGATFGRTTTNLTSHQLLLPAGLAVGDRIFALFCLHGSNGGAAPSGWTQLHVQDIPTGQSSVGLFYRDRQVGDANVVTWSSSASCNSAQLGFSIKAGTFDPAAPVFASLSSSGATATPPTATDPAGAAKQLAVALIAINNGRFISAYPLPDNKISYTTSGSPYEEVAMCTTLFEGASYSPGAFTMVTSQSWIAFTLLVRGA